MLPKAQRFDLRKHPDYLRTATKVFLPTCVVYFNAQSGTSQAAIVVSKKVAAHAVVRNTIKRKLRALLSPLLAQFSGKVMVLVMKKVPTSTEYQEIQERITQLLSR